MKECNYVTGLNKFTNCSNTADFFFQTAILKLLLPYIFAFKQMNIESIKVGTYLF